MSAWSVKTRRALSRHCRDARVYGHIIRLRPCIIMSTPPPFLCPRLRVVFWYRIKSFKISVSNCRYPGKWYWSFDMTSIAFLPSIPRHPRVFFCRCSTIESFDISKYQYQTFDISYRTLDIINIISSFRYIVSNVFLPSTPCRSRVFMLVQQYRTNASTCIKYRARIYR